MRFTAHLSRFGALLCTSLAVLTAQPGHAQQTPTMQKRWFFVWRDMNDPKEVDRVIARLPEAHAAGYNGLALGANVAPSRAAQLREAAKKNGISLVAIVMGGSKDKNNVEGLLSKDALFTAENGTLKFVPDNPTKLTNADFENSRGDHMNGWGFQDDEGVTTFVDHQVVHGGTASLRMESFGKNQYQHARIAQPLKLQPQRQYHISVWVKTQDLVGAVPEVKVLTAKETAPVSFQSFHCEPTQDWKKYDLCFNSMNCTDANIYLGTWSGKSGKIWWDDLKVEEMALVNVLRRPGCPVTVKGEDGTVYTEGKDYAKVIDYNLHPWVGYHEPAVIRLTDSSRIKPGQRLRVSYYHPIICYEDRVNYCISEEKIFDEWRQEIVDADKLLHPVAFLMSHDEMRVMNQCALCQSKNMTAGQLLAENIHRAAGIIRSVRPDAEIWVWNDMFDPMHNAIDHYYAVNGTLAGSWKGLDKDVGIVNWLGSLNGKNCPFFASLGLKQILSGYYDGDEDGSGIAGWIKATSGVKGIVGAMYTTWEDKYGALTPWAKKAWGAAH